MSRPVSDPEPSHQAFYDLRQMRSVPIRSIVGQTQFYLSHVLPRPGAPEEDLLLCRYANTIDESCGQLELRQLKRLVRHLELKISERRFGHVDPIVAREVEKEIVLRNEPDYAAGHDLTPAMRLLDGYERDGPVFTQPERNLLLRVQFCSGDPAWVEKIAQDFMAKQCSRRKIIDICRTLEQAELSWAGLDTMDGLSYLPTKPPRFSMSLKNCEDPATNYPPYAYYPALSLPQRSAVLQNGILLFPAQTGWWRSGIRKVDQPFTAPHFYKADGGMGFEIADEEHRILFQQEPTQPEPEQGMTMGMSL